MISIYPWRFEIRCSHEVIPERFYRKSILFYRSPIKALEDDKIVAKPKFITLQVYIATKSCSSLSCSEITEKFFFLKTKEAIV